MVRTGSYHLAGRNDSLHAFGKESHFRSRLHPIGFAGVCHNRQITVPASVDHHRCPPFGAASGVVADIEQVPVPVTHFYTNLLLELSISFEMDTISCTLALNLS